MLAPIQCIIKSIQMWQQDWHLTRKKVIIIPGFKEKIAHVLLKIFPTSLSLRFAGMGQKRKRAK